MRKLITLVMLVLMGWCFSSSAIAAADFSSVPAALSAPHVVDSADQAASAAASSGAPAFDKGLESWMENASASASDGDRGLAKARGPPVQVADLSPNALNRLRQGLRYPLASVLKSPATLFIIAEEGQSQGQALGTTAANNNGNVIYPAHAPTGSINSRSLIWNNGTNQCEPYVAFGNSNPGATEAAWGPEAQLLYRLTTADAVNSYCVVKGNVGSTGLASDPAENDWSPTDNPVELYGGTLLKFNNAKAWATSRYASVVTLAVLFTQGEQDAKDTSKSGAYQTNLTGWANAIQSDMAPLQIINRRLILEQVSSGFVIPTNGTTTWKQVYDAQGAVHGANPTGNMQIVSSDGMATVADRLHANTYSTDLLGDRMYDVMLGSQWWARAPYAGLAFIADIGNDRFACTSSGVTRSCLAGDILTVSTTGTTQRTYMGADGTIHSDLAANTLRFTYEGGKRQLLIEGPQQNAALYSNDLTQTAWVALGATVAFDQVGRDYQAGTPASTASSITATAANATVTQMITAASAARVFAADVKCLVCTGAIQMTTDGGATWTTQPVVSGWLRFALSPQTVTNPTIGFRIANAGDKIAVQFAQSEVNVATSRIKTLTAAVTRPAENIGLTTAAAAFLQGTSATYAFRGTGAPQSAATLLGADTSNLSLLARTSGGSLTANNGTSSPGRTAGSGTFASGPWGVVGGYDATGNRLAFNGSAITTDANQPAAHTAPPVGRTTSAGSTSYLDSGVDFIGFGSSLLADATLAAIATGNLVVAP